MADIDYSEERFKGIKWLDDPPEPESGIEKPTTRQSEGREFTANELLRQLGLTGRAAIKGATGTSGALADAIVAGLNKSGMTNLPLPTKAQEELMTRFGVPAPKDAQEKHIQMLAQMVGGSVFDPFMAGASRATREMMPGNVVLPERVGHFGPMTHAGGEMAGSMVANSMGLPRWLGRATARTLMHGNPLHGVPFSGSPMMQRMYPEGAISLFSNNMPDQ